MSSTPLRFLITAGPTREFLDPIRYVSNRSSGRMGFAIAEAALAVSSNVTLVSGPTCLTAPKGVEFVPVTAAQEMAEAVWSRFGSADICIMAAAVCDFRPKTTAGSKIKKGSFSGRLELEPTPDILAELGRKRGDRLLIGFAAETENLREEARRKLETKNCDMVVANLVGQADTGFESDSNEVLLALRTGEFIPLERASKREIADRILSQILKLRRALSVSQ